VGVAARVSQYIVAVFALDYTEDLRKRWWELPCEKLQECKHLIFRSKIIVQADGTVYTLI